MQVVCNANKLAELVEKRKKMRNWLDYYQIKYSRNQSKRPMKKVNFCTKMPMKDYITLYCSIGAEVF